MPDYVFTGMPRGLPGQSPREMEAPAAMFEDPDAILASRALAASRDKIFLGVLGAQIKTDDAGKRFAQGGQLIGVRDDAHMITIAGSRAGKGRAALIPNMLHYEGSVLAIDPKGELALASAAFRAQKLGQRVCVVDPFGTTRGRLKALEKGFNPIATMTADSAIEDAALIADALVIVGGTDPHWDESARTIIEGLILEVFSATRFEGRRNLVTVRDLLSEGDVWHDQDEKVSPMEALQAYMAESTWPAVQRAAADFFERPDKERDSVLSSARRHMRALSFPEIERSLKGESFALGDLKRQALSVYLCLPGRHVGTCGRWLRLFINLALQAMETTDAFTGAAPGQTATGAPVLFALDEFASLGHMRQIEDAAGQIAGFGVKLWPVLQDLGQLKALYKERWETFMGNAGILQFFGNNDLTTLEWVSKRLGTVTIEQLSVSAVTPQSREHAASGENYAPRTVNLLEPDEIALFFGRDDEFLRQLIIRPSYNPMILQRAFYDKHQAFSPAGK